MSTVYVVEAGEDYEGGKILGIASCLDVAREIVDDYISKSHRKEQWTPEDNFNWKKGCNYLSISEWKPANNISEYLNEMETRYFSPF